MIKAVAALLVSVAAALPCAPLHAGPPDDPLAGIVEEALQRNLQLEGARQAARRASADLNVARLQWLPSVRLETRASRLEGAVDLGEFVNPAYAALNQVTGTDAFPTDVSYTLPLPYESHFVVTQPLINEPLRANVAAASAGRDAQRSARDATARAVAAEAQAAWLRQASARRMAEIYDATLALVRENERAARALLAAGKATPEALHRARADRAEVEQQRDDAREQAAAAAREFNRIVGRPLEAPVETLADSLFAAAPAVGLDEAVRSALERREELHAQRAGVRAADAAVRAATGAFLPSIAGAFDVRWQGSEWTLHEDERSWTASLVASWDLFRGGSDLARRSAARAEARRARLAEQDAAERITVEVRNAWNAARVSHEALAPAALRVEAARRTWSLVRLRYAEGAASPLELTDARTQLTSAELNQVLTLYRYALRRVDLERAAALRDLPVRKGAAR